MEDEPTASEERTINIGLGTVVAIVAAVAAVRRRSPWLLVLALAAAGAEVVYRRRLARPGMDGSRQSGT